VRLFDREATFQRNIPATAIMCRRPSGSGAPEGTRSFLLICDDPDAPAETFHHWAAFDIPPDWRGLREGHGAESLTNGFRQAINDSGKPGYSGPCPPLGDKPHRYHLQLNALSEASLPVAPSATCLEVITLATPYVLEFVELVGLYQRLMKHKPRRVGE